jgi:hypothetical protein
MTDFRSHAEKACGLLEEWLWFFTGADDSSDTSSLVQRTIDVTTCFQQESGPSKFNLRSLVNLAIKEAAKNHEDPAAAVLKVIAERTESCNDHFTDDQHIYQDIADWLAWEAQQPEYQL